MEHDYKPADIAVLLDKVCQYAILDINSPFPHEFVPAQQYQPNKQEQLLLEEYRTNPKLARAVNVVHRASMLHLDNMGINASDIASVMKGKADEQLSLYHRWQKSIEEETGMSIYDFALRLYNAIED